MREQRAGAAVQGLQSQALRVAAKQAGGQVTAPQCPGKGKSREQCQQMGTGSRTYMHKAMR